MRTLPVHLDRLETALAAKGVRLKRHSLLEVAAAAFGYHSQNQLAAAAKAGDLDPPPARPLGSANLAGHRLVLLEDAQGRPFAMDADVLAAREKTDAFVSTPYGGLADLRHLGEIAPLPAAGTTLSHYAAISHEYGADLYQDATEEGLNRQIADWCRGFWQSENTPGSFEGLSDEAVIEAYFAHSAEEGVTYFQPKPAPAAPAAARSEPYVPDHFRLRDPYVIGRMTGDLDEPVLYWSSEDGWVDAQTATVFAQPQDSWPVLGIDPGTLFVVPLPAMPRAAAYPNRNGAGLDIVFLTNRAGDVQGPEDRAEEALPWIDEDEIDVGLGPVRTAEIGYAALVDDAVFLAPTIKAFHFDASDSVRAMMENRDELQAYADAIEPRLKAVGGMAMIEEDTEAVTLTVFIPLAEARRAADLDAWKEALQELLTPDGHGPRIKANFRPQTMIAGGCYDADALGETSFDVTYELKLMGEDAARALQDSDDEAESLREAVMAPAWIRDWSGPFGIEVRTATADYYGFDPEDME
jgi:hypothetical protein